VRGRWRSCEFVVFGGGKGMRSVGKRLCCGRDERMKGSGMLGWVGSSCFVHVDVLEGVCLRACLLAVSALVLIG